jgi:hypothetical protein
MGPLTWYMVVGQGLGLMFQAYGSMMGQPQRWW